MNKYGLTNETIIVSGITLHRIRALKDFGAVKAGDLGGFVESEDNLSHDGDCWVAGNARVSGTAHVSGAARLSGSALVSDAAQVHRLNS